MSLKIPLEALVALWPHAPPMLRVGIASTSAVVLAKYKIATLVDLIDFLAQISEETGGGIALSENLNYSALRLTQVWPSRFPNAGDAAKYAGNPIALANNVYGGRYGNVLGTDDGWNFRGRGLIQLTFRANYAALEKTTGLDLIAHPDLVVDPMHALECAAAYWSNAGVNPIANSGDFTRETIRINGGLTNLAARVAWKRLWTKALTATNTAAPAAPAAQPIAPSPAPLPSPAERLDTITATLAAKNATPAHEGFLARLEAILAEWV